MNNKDKYVYEVYRNGSFSKAARTLFVTQPTLSTMIKNAETELGFTIFDRSSSPLSLTDAGRIYIQYLENLRMNEEALSEQLSELSRSEHGHLTIGATSYNMSIFAPGVLKRMYEHHPGIRIDILEGDVHQLHEMLLSGVIDLLIDNFQADHIPPGFDLVPILKEHILLAVPAASPLNKELVSWQVSMDTAAADPEDMPVLPDHMIPRLFDEEYIVVRQGYAIRNQVEAIFSRFHKTLNPRLECNQISTVLQFVQAGLGMGFATDIIRISAMHYDGICFYRLPDDSVRTLCIAIKKGRYRSYAMRAFLEKAKDA